jgi:hypothetical protein
MRLTIFRSGWRPPWLAPFGHYPNMRCNVARVHPFRHATEPACLARPGTFSHFDHSVIANGSEYSAGNTCHLCQAAFRTGSFRVAVRQSCQSAGRWYRSDACVRSAWFGSRAGCASTSLPSSAIGSLSWIALAPMRTDTDTTLAFKDNYPGFKISSLTIPLLCSMLCITAASGPP